MQPTADPDEVGLDPRALTVLDDRLRRLVEDRRMAGWQLVISRSGRIGHVATYGWRDLTAHRPVTPDTLWRIYSMTKPITTVAAMLLHEEGHFTLSDEVSRWLPEFAEAKVWDAQRGAAVPAEAPVRMWHLMTHTAGMTYHFYDGSPVHDLYRSAYDEELARRWDTAATVGQWASMPLLYQPGTRWGYSVATDVLGYLVEVISGQSLADFFAERIFLPLGMTDACWWVEASDRERLARVYEPGTLNEVPANDRHLARPARFSGGGGLVCTAADYQRFTASLLGVGDAPALLKHRTVDVMTRNHLPHGVDVSDIHAHPTNLYGVGFGLGFAVVRDPAGMKEPVSPGTYYWGGATGTLFWIDPSEQLTVEFYTATMPSTEEETRPLIRQLIYAALE